MMAITTSSSINVNAERGHLPDAAS